MPVDVDFSPRKRIAQFSSRGDVCVMSDRFGKRRYATIAFQSATVD
jgi:hypothetical protein